MGTEYTVFNKDTKELVVYEHSSLLDLTLEDLDLTLEDNIERNSSLRNLTPTQLAAIGIELLRIADYQNNGISQWLGQEFPTSDTQAWARRQLGRE